jgi:hypothetical protein
MGYPVRRRKSRLRKFRTDRHAPEDRCRSEHPSARSLRSVLDLLNRGRNPLARECGFPLSTDTHRTLRFGAGFQASFLQIFFEQWHSFMDRVRATCKRLSRSPAVLLALALALAPPTALQASDAEYHHLAMPGIQILYDDHLDRTAATVLASVPAVREDLRQAIGWSLNEPFTIALISNRNRYLRMAPSPLYLAFAIPERRLVVMDQSRMSHDAVLLDGTLRHELCHLLLHEHIQAEHLPRWVDEGVCQWVSEGFSELLHPELQVRVEELATAGRSVPFSRLQQSFSGDPEAVQEAYAQGRSMVDYLVRVGGRERLLAVLRSLAAGNEWDKSIEAVYGRSFRDLEAAWRGHTTSRVRRTVLLVGAHLYEIIFFMAALAAVLGFYRRRRKLRRYSSELDDDQED